MNNVQSFQAFSSIARSVVHRNRIRIREFQAYDCAEGKTLQEGTIATYDVGVISGPATLVSAEHGEIAELEDVAIPIKNDGLTPNGYLATAPAFKEFRLHRHREDELYLVFKGLAGHRVPVRMVAAFLAVNGLLQTRRANEWVEERWRDLHDAYKSTQV